MIQETPHSIANYVSLMRQQYTGAFLILEGSNDGKLLENYVDNENCQIKVARGKERVLSVLQILNSRKVSGVLGIVDADFDRIEQSLPNIDNIVSPEFHDLDVVLIRSPAMLSVLKEYGSVNKIQELTRDPINFLDDAARPLANLRLYSLRRCLRLKFNGVDYGSFVDRTSLEPNQAKMVDRVMDNSQNHFDGIPDVVADLNVIERQGYPEHEMCTGRDLLEILSIALKKKIGSVTNHTLITADELRRYFRMSYDRSMFESSDLYKSIRLWENRAKSFKILK